MIQTVSVNELASLIPDGAKIAIPPDGSGVAMALTHALIRCGLRNLHLVCVPTAGLQADLLIGSGCVGTVETSAISLGEYGAARRFQAGLKSGQFRMLDATCPAIHAGIQASAKGVPFMAMRGLIGSDVLVHRPDWRVIDNPYVEHGDLIVLLPAIQPEFSIFHAPYADRAGNVFIGPRRELANMAQASRKTLVTVEEIRDVDLLADDASAAGALTAVYVDHIAVAPQGAHPLGLPGCYGNDAIRLARYAELARSDEGFSTYVDEFVFNRQERGVKQDA